MAEFNFGPAKKQIGNFTGAGASTAGETGLVPAPSSGDNTKFLKGDGTWGEVPNPSVMTGATSSTAGTSGLIPAPSAGDQDKVLTGGGTWEAIPSPDLSSKRDEKLSRLMDEYISGTTQEVTYDSDSNVSSITHSASGTAVRTDIFTYGTNTITEVRTLTAGGSLTLVTNTSTLVTTVTYVA